MEARREILIFRFVYSKNIVGYIVEIFFGWKTIVDTVDIWLCAITVFAKDICRLSVKS
jgi:hypothetical protein